MNYKKNNRTSFDNYLYFSDLETITKAINGYRIADETWYSQIYVPFHEQVNLEEMPVIAIGHSGKEEVLLGYQLGMDGMVSVIMVDEKYAQNHLVWVISVNESVGNNGKLSSTKTLIGTTLQKISPIFITTNEVKISDKKEKWHQGKAEVRIGRANIDTPMPNTNCNNMEWNTPETQVKIGNSDLDTWVTFVEDVSFGNGHDPSNDRNSNRLDPGETVLFMLYEYDRRANLREKIFTPCFHSYYYRSDDDFYMAWGPFENMDYADFPNPATSPSWSYRTRSEGSDEVKFRYKKF